VGGSFSSRAGSSIHFEDVGSGAPILALPGVGGGSFFFDEWSRLLEAKFRILSVDLPGIGRSVSVPRAFSMESWVRDLGDFVSQRIAAPAVLLGHSLGTMLALKACVAWPRWVRGIIFVGGLPKVRPDVSAHLVIRAEDIARNGLDGWGARVSPRIFSAATLRDRPEMVRRFEHRFETQHADAYVRSLEILRATDANGELARLCVPCVSISGSEDNYAPPADVEEFTRRIPGGCPVEILSDCGHMPFWEAPDALARAVERFVLRLET
jgi:pimeloyl-ACP methyl ester carboxylesterase